MSEEKSIINNEHEKTAMSNTSKENPKIRFFTSKMHGNKKSIFKKHSSLELSRSYKEKLLESKKLVLIVDLDETLVHSTDLNVPSDVQEIEQVESGGEYFNIKFRPYTEWFLKNISKYYDLVIFTLAEREYANAITKLLDPKGNYFGRRIFSRRDSVSETLKSPNLKHMFPCGDNMVCMIDDRKDVWESAPNLIQVTKYLYFDGNVNIIEPIETTNFEDEFEDFEHKTKWEDFDEYLLQLKNILIKIHSSFYNNYRDQGETKQMDLKRIIPEEKKNVLRGCNIFFRGIFINKAVENWAITLAVEYGAIIQKEVVTEGDNRTTHVVGVSEDEEIMDIEHGICSVHVDWLFDSCEIWIKLDENLYPFTADV